MLGTGLFNFHTDTELVGSHKYASLLLSLALAMSYWTRLTQTAVCFVDKNDKVMCAPAGQPGG